MKGAILCLLGPTASGKTELACEIARHLPVDLISVDSAMIYRGMDIGTATPTPAELGRFPHALVNILDPAETFSAADFVERADDLVRATLASGRVPLLVGGTMLYFRAFRDGLAELPAADPEIRDAITAEAAERGWQALHDELARVDPVAAAGIHPNNPQRLQRALEVWRASGEPISRFWSRQQASGVLARLGVTPVEVALRVDDRQRLHERIETRFHSMLDAGLVDEVADLRARGDLTPQLPSMRAVGYRQVWSYLDGDLAREQMVERAVAASRQLAKRQLTWLRGWRDHVRPVVADHPRAELARQIAGYLELS